MQMEQSHIDMLRNEFSLREEAQALIDYLSNRNYDAYIGAGTRPLEGAVGMAVGNQNQNQAATAGPPVIDGLHGEEFINSLADSTGSNHTQCCATQPQGLHVFPCPNYHWSQAAEDAFWATQASAFGLPNDGWDTANQDLEMDGLEGVLVPEGPMIEFNATASGRRRRVKAESSNTTGERMDGVISSEAPSRSRKPRHSRPVFQKPSAPPTEDPHCCNRKPSAPHAPYCVNRHEQIPLWSNALPTYLLPDFEFFTKLPHELRTTIYELALSNDAPIAPQLCDKAPNGRVQFHDARQHSRQNPNHIAISRLLGVTRVSKQIRAESLPCFYSANTFSITCDTPTYFGYLEYLGRFNLIRRVELNIPKFDAPFAPQILAQMKTYMSNVKSYEAKTPFPAPLGSAERKGKMRASSTLPPQGAYQYFVKHPRYIMGGMKDMGMLIIAGMLSSRTATSAFPTPLPSSLSSNSEKNSTSHLILPAPTSTIFTAHPTLTWFASVLRGLDITLHLIPDRPLLRHYGCSICILWEQRYQKSEFEIKKGSSGVDVDKRVSEMWPELGEDRGRFWERMTYLRGGCDGMEHVWWDVRF